MTPGQRMQPRRPPRAGSACRWSSGIEALQEPAHLAVEKQAVEAARGRSTPARLRGSRRRSSRAPPGWPPSSSSPPPPAGLEPLRARPGCASGRGSQGWLVVAFPGAGARAAATAGRAHRAAGLAGASGWRGLRRHRCLARRGAAPAASACMRSGRWSACATGTQHLLRAQPRAEPLDQFVQLVALAVVLGQEAGAGAGPGRGVERAQAQPARGCGQRA